MPKKKSVKELQAEMTRLAAEIKRAEQEELLKEIISSTEFKTLSRKFAKLNIPPAVIAKLFTATRKTAVTVNKTGVKVPPKYKHPDNPKLLWSGRGRQPLWVKECLEEGKTLQDLLIKK